MAPARTDAHGRGGAARAGLARRRRECARPRRRGAGGRARVVVFPELSLTGYELDAPAIAPDRSAAPADRGGVCRDRVDRPRGRARGRRRRRRRGLHRPARRSMAAASRWRIGRCGSAPRRPTASRRARAPRSSRSTGGGSASRSVATPASPSTPRTPRRSASTHTSPARSRRSTRRRSSTSAAAGSRPSTACGSRSRASRARPAAGTRQRPEVRRSGRRAAVPVCVLDAEPGRIGRATLGRA